MALVSRRFSELVNSPYVWRSAFLRFFSGSTINSETDVSPQRRYFSRLTANSTWKNEYSLRTTLLRSFAKGKVLDMSARSVRGSKEPQSLLITYDSKCNNTVTHLSVKFPNLFETGGSKALPRLYSGSTFSNTVTISDYTIGKTERGLWQKPGHFPPEFLSSVPGFNRDYFCPNNRGAGVMDLSEGLGWVFGESIPNGNLYVFAHCTNDNLLSAQSGFRMARPLQLTNGTLIDGNGSDAGISSVWMAKTRRAGTILDTSEGKIGILSASSKGCVSAFALPWTTGSLAPEDWNLAWASWYVCPGIPILSICVDNEYSTRRNRMHRPWCVILNAVGEVWYSTTLPTPDASAASWKIIPSTRQLAAQKLAGGASVVNQHLEEMLLRDWKVVRAAEPLWGNDWWIEVDWADETIIRGRKITDFPISRFHRTKNQQTMDLRPRQIRNSQQPSIFGSSEVPPAESDPSMAHTWISSDLDFTSDPDEQHFVTAVGMDNSYLCQISTTDTSVDDIPGSNARFLAVGTNEGIIFVWNIRESHTSPTVYPLRRIQTSSPEITTVAVSSLILVAGGNDGLVAAYDPLSSSSSPLRILHSHFTRRARRRLAQVPEQNAVLASNQYAARSCILDPDPTSLRGVVALGSHIRHWSIASDSSQNSARRRKKKLARQSIAATRLRNKSSGSDYQGLIKTEVSSLKKEAMDSDRENDRLEGRFGISYRMPGANDLTEEELVAYAELLSKEAYENSQLPNCPAETTGQGMALTPASASESSYFVSEDETFARELDEAIAASLAIEQQVNPANSVLGMFNGESSNSNCNNLEVVEASPETLEEDSMDEELRLALRLSLLDC